LAGNEKRSGMHCRKGEGRKTKKEVMLVKEGGLWTLSVKKSRKSISETTPFRSYIHNRTRQMGGGELRALKSGLKKGEKGKRGKTVAFLVTLWSKVKNYYRKL